MINNFAFAGDVVPSKPGVYLCTTDSQHCFGFFLGWFNGQYWYEYERGCDDPHLRKRKKTARLSVTAWSHINASIFSAPLREEKKAPTALHYTHPTRPEKELWKQLRESGAEHT
ncbi:hypothetical protein [Pseudomonas putida]|uniref:hypothetical protein n=1 Tax=Pseudomonas putida TaxID=303 RepID=UPI002765C5F2|nr:hypothetical protein [Pseudomonas putida]MDP9523531.1 hypothetical protein [Pseudomonas putida]